VFDMFVDASLLDFCRLARTITPLFGHDVPLLVDNIHNTNQTFGPTKF
jgi:hypothetical protein